MSGRRPLTCCGKVKFWMALLWEFESYHVTNYNISFWYLWQKSDVKIIRYTFCFLISLGNYYWENKTNDIPSFRIIEKYIFHLSLDLIWCAVSLTLEDKFPFRLVMCYKTGERAQGENLSKTGDLFNFLHNRDLESGRHNTLSFFVWSSKNESENEGRL